MNLEVRLGLQKVNSSFYDEFNDEEIDAALNKAQLRFVNRRFLKLSDKMGFEEIQKRLDDVRGLVIRDRSLNIFNYDESSQYAIFPPDYLYLISDISQIDYHCDGLNATDGTGLEGVAKVTMPTSEEDPYYANFTITYDQGGLDEEVIFNITNYTSLGFSSVEEKYRLIDLILEVMADKYRKGEVTFQVYFERYRDDYQKDTFFFVSHATQVVAQQTVLVEAGKTMQFSTDAAPVTTNGTFTATVVPPGTRSHSVTTGLISKWSPNRLTESEELYQVLEHSFGKTNYRSPVSSIDESRIVVYHNETFILKGLKISYIRTPNKISLVLNRSCELAGHTHPEIVDITVSSLLERVEARRYQTSKIEENLNE